MNIVECKKKKIHIGGRMIIVCDILLLTSFFPFENKRLIIASTLLFVERIKMSAMSDSIGKICYMKVEKKNYMAVSSQV